MAEVQLSVYDILGIAFTANDDDIHSAYRRMVKRWHPDVAGENGREMFEDIQKAYEVLSDPKKKKRYDALRKLQEMEIKSLDYDGLQYASNNFRGGSVSFGGGSIGNQPISGSLAAYGIYVHSASVYMPGVTNKWTKP